MGSIASTNVAPFLPQHHPHLVHGPHLLSRRMAKHLLLPLRRLFRGDGRLLRSLLYLRLLRPSVSLHRSRPAQPEGLFPWGPAKAVASPSELARRLLWWTTWDL